MWKDAYLIGHEQIDNQHKQLLGALDDLLVCLKKDPDRAGAKCKQTVGFLKAYSVHHFAAEEILQEAIGYEDIEGHRKMHEFFKDTVHEFEMALIRGSYSLETVQLVSRMLTNWWIFHIVKEDGKMRDYINPKAAAADG